MNKSFLLILLLLVSISNINAQDPIQVGQMATFNAYAGTAPDSSTPYFGDLGVRRVIVADPDNDGIQEIISTDYSNGGRVHVMEFDGGNNLEIIWSSPVYTTSSGSSPRFPQVGDCDGDGMPEIIFEQNNSYGSNLGRILFFEWDGSSWGAAPTFEIDNAMFIAAGASGNLRLNRETLLVKDLDGDGKSEIVPHCYGNSNRDVYVLGIEGTFPGFATLVIEGGHPDNTANGFDWATGSYFSTTAADIDGDSKYELINNHWNECGMWAVQVNGNDSYTFPDTTKPGFYRHYSPAGNDGVSYFGMAAVDVDGDGKHEIAGTLYQDEFKTVLFDFNDADTSANLFLGDSASVSERFGVIATKEELAGLGNKTTGEFWPCVTGDVNQDGKDEIYTGGGRGINLIAIQYSGTGSVLDGNNYVKNLVYSGEGGDVFAKIKIYHGRVDTVVVGTDTTFILDPSVIDTVKEETPFTAYIFADSVDIDNDNKLEIVLSEQSVYDSTEIIHYVWADSTQSWERDLIASHKIINEYRKTVRILEYDGFVGIRDENYNVITPEDYVIENNYPNPFNPSTTINFAIPVQKKISIKIYDMLGKEVKTLLNNSLLEKGNHQVVWDGKNNQGSLVSSGNYIATMSYGNFSKSIKMTLLK